MFDTLYVQIFLDRMIVRSTTAGRDIEVLAEQAFSHPRTLVGDFTAADALMRKGVKAIQAGRLVLRTKAVVHPRERLEGGLTQVEERCLHELAFGAGATKVVVWTGHTLTDAEVGEKLA